MEKVRTLVVDDEPLARERVRSLLAERSDVEVVGEASDGQQAIALIESAEPELILLDIQMPEVDGFDVIQAIGTEKMPVVIFITAYDQFAIRAFDAHALDYLLKPFDRERFGRALDRAVARVEQRRRGDLEQRLEALLEGVKPQPRYLERIMVRSGGRILFIRVEEIDWIEAEGNYLCLHLGKRTHLLRETMSGIEEKLDPGDFMRIHRSTIVNINRIRALESVFQGEYLVILEDGTKLNSSRGYRDKLQELMETAS